MAIEWIIGVLATALVALISYSATRRHFAGVDVERGASARKDIESMLTRSIVQQGLNPSLSEIQRIISSKAREYNTSPKQIARPEQIVEDIYTKTVGNDFIVPRLKKKIITTLDKILTAKKPLKVSRLELLLRSRERRLEERRRMLISLIAATAATILAVILQLFLSS